MSEFDSRQENISTELIQEKNWSISKRTVSYL